MILFDTSQVIISAVTDYWRKTKEPVEIDLIRHIAIKTILGLKDKVLAGGDDLGDVVLCVDGRNYWRKSVFPLYKKSRSKSREKDSFDWVTFFNIFNQLKTEFKENLPLKLLEVETAEADDLISVLTRRYAPHEKVVIVSSDHDFIQLHAAHQNIYQFSPFHKKYLKIDHNEYSLFEHIVKGDPGDGIPNILTDDDVFMAPEKRSKPISKKKLSEWLSVGSVENPEKFCTSIKMLENFKRNRLLVDLTMIPSDLTQRIIEEYDSIEAPKNRLFNYLIEHRLKKIMERGKF